MDANADFNQKTPLGDTPAQQFSIKVADGAQGKNFSIRPLANNRYEILDEQGTIGTIQLDETNHAHCESVGCELDMPLLHSIREQIQFHEQWKAAKQ